MLIPFTFVELTTLIIIREKHTNALNRITEMRGLNNDLAEGFFFVVACSLDNRKRKCLGDTRNYLKLIST